MKIKLNYYKSVTEIIELPEKYAFMNKPYNEWTEEEDDMYELEVIPFIDDYVVKNGSDVDGWDWVD